MKVPRDGSESKTETRKGNQRANCCGDGKTSEDNRECSGSKNEEGDVSGCGIEPSTTALIPPWLRNSLGLAEKGDKKPNQKCLKVFCATNECTPCVETYETKVDSDGDCLKCHFYIQDSPITNPILEVNIGSEADFLQDAGSAEKLSSPWRSKSSRQYESGLFGTIKDREMTRSVKSEVTSIDVVVPLEDQEEDRRKFRPHKAKPRMGRRTSNGCYKSEDNPKVDIDTICRSAATLGDFLIEESVSNTKYLDERLLLLCGKKTIDHLTQEDVALLQEMKNQIGHKEGFEKLFSEIRESAFAERGTTKDEKKSERREEMYRREAVKDYDKAGYFLCKSEENRVKNRMVDEERKLPDDGRKHYGNKVRNQQRQMKCTYEPEGDKKGDKWKCSGQRSRDGEKEKKTKLRHCDYSVIEKVVSETLQKFIDLYRVQVPPDVVNSMKKNIIQTLQSEYHETNGSRRGLDAVLAVQDQLKSAGVIKCSMHHLLMEDREDKHNAYKDAGAKRLEASTNFTSEENVVSKDVPEGNEKVGIAYKEETGKAETLNILRKDFERCLDLMQYQLDVTGTRLCSVVLEKTGTEDKKLRIVHNFSNGVTESIKIYDKPCKGSPEGDNLNTAVCDCQQNFQKTKIKLNQWSQTREKTYGKISTQTDWVDVSVRHLMNADLNPGLYRITKATESGRFYLTPEVLDDDDDDDDDDVNESNQIKRVSSEMCVPPDVGQFKGEVVKYSSRETFVSERANFGSVKTLWRAFRSDCVGLNNLNIGALSRALVKAPMDNLTDAAKAMKEQRVEEVVEEVVEIEVEEEMEDEVGDFVQKKSSNTMEGNSNPDGYHKECVWLWNGKKMSPGVDLKVHVEDLLREKLNEMLCEGRITEAKWQNESAVISNSNMTTAEVETSAKNLEIRKTRAKFCITNEEGIPPMSSPFIFSGSGPNRELADEAPSGRTEGQTVEKSVREVGTQNSQHAIVALNISKMKQRSKLCTVAKFSKRKQSNKLQHATSKTVHPFAESVGEAKKVKLEFREGNDFTANREKGSNTDSVRESFSIISHGSSSSSDGPVRVKLIGIEVSKEKSSGNGDFCSTKSSDTKGSTAEESTTKKDEPKKYKHWEIIENVLNRVSQKEKDILWNDIRDFVKKKIGRDINDEGAREVCIEIEQDVPKFAKGKASHMVVAKGNYTRTEGDVEVEVDLTLDDLERILRHRQKKMRRRMHSQKTECKVSSTSSDTVTDYHTFKCRSFVEEEYITNNEMKMLKEYN